MRRIRLLAGLMVSGLAGGLAGCASYVPAPLDLAARLPTEVTAEGKSAIPEIDPARPLTLPQVKWLAMTRNPDLIAARAQAPVAAAQITEAGLPPNPVIGGNYGFFMGGPGFLNSIGASLTEDIRALLTLASRRQAAAESARQIDASLLWQEWQIVGKAQLLFIDLVEGDRLQAVLHRTLDLMQDRLARTRRALATGDTTLTMLAPDLAAVTATQRQLDDVERQQAGRRRDLNILLGLAPGAALRLQPAIDVPVIASSEVEAALPDLARRRPDLVALRYGYDAQETRLRGAVLGQFPALSFGASGSRDNSDVRAFGPQISFDLPIFDRNQGNIAIETATRDQLRHEFTARLIAAKAEAQALSADCTLLERQLATVRSQLRVLQRLTLPAAGAFRAGDLDERSYVDFASATLAKEQELIALEQTRFEQNAALSLLLGIGLPPIGTRRDTIPDRRTQP